MFLLEFYLLFKQLNKWEEIIMDIFKMIYGWLGLVPIFAIFFYFKKMEGKYKSINKGTIKTFYLYDILGFAGIICIPYAIVGIFLVGGIHVTTLIFNFILIILSIFSLLCFIYAKVYKIEYSSNFFIIKKLKNSIKYGYDEVDVIIKPTLFRVYKNEKKNMHYITQIPTKFI